MAFHKIASAPQALSEICGRDRSRKAKTLRRWKLCRGLVHESLARKGASGTNQLWPRYRI